MCNKQALKSTHTGLSLIHISRKNDRAAGHLLALLTIIIWGTTFVATKTLLRDYDALQIMLMRFFLAWVLLLLLTRRIEKPVSLKEEAGIFALSLSGVSLYSFFENTALTYTPVSYTHLVRRGRLRLRRRAFSEEVGRRGRTPGRGGSL